MVRLTDLLTTTGLSFSTSKSMVFRLESVSEKLLVHLYMLERMVFFVFGLTGEFANTGALCVFGLVVNSSSKKIDCNKSGSEEVVDDNIEPAEWV